LFAQISHDRAKKGTVMWMILIGLAVYLLLRGVLAAFGSLRNIPRNNRDWIFF
jgi:hypothetical protein